MEAPYLNREIDSKFTEVHAKLDEIIILQKYTNGKIKKITIAITLLAGVLVGAGVTDGIPLLKTAIALL